MNYTGHIFCPDGIFRAGKIIVENNVIVDIIFDDKYEGLADYIIPGLIDIHLHGAAGHDFSEGTEKALKAIERYEKSKGIVAFCGATMTLPKEKLCQIAKASSIYDKNAFKGIYLEGPFISEKRCGAQNSEHICDPDIHLLYELNEISKDYIKYVVIAPEKDGAIDFIEEVSLDTNMNVCLGHTDCDYDQAVSAFVFGASQVTHLYNAMPEFDKRSPGLIGAAFDKAKYIELICDGQHVHPAAVRMTYEMFDDEKVILISDSTMATGLDEGRYMLGDKPIIVKDGKAVLEDGTLAGSCTDLYDCLINAIRFGVPMEKAIKSATINPAMSLGIDDYYGSIEIGKSGELLVIKELPYIRQNKSYLL